MHNQSEVARLRTQLDLEYTAMMRALTGPALVAQHEMITARMERMGDYHEQLVGLIGERKAAEYLVQALEGPGQP